MLGAVGAGMVALTGCSTGPSAGSGTGGDGVTTGTSNQTAAPSTTAPPDPSRVDLPLADERLPMQHTAETFRDGVQSGGQPKDGIPSIDEPRFWSAADADAFRGSLKTVTDNAEEAFDLLRLALAEPRFEEADVERVRAAVEEVI